MKEKKDSCVVEVLYKIQAGQVKRGSKKTRISFFSFYSFKLLAKEEGRIEIQPCINPISYEKPL